MGQGEQQPSLFADGEGPSGHESRGMRGRPELSYSIIPDQEHLDLQKSMAL